MDQTTIPSDPCITSEPEAMPTQPGNEPSQDLGTTFQARVQPWLMECFGPIVASDREERNHRFLEWKWEPLPSGRDDAFRERCRFTSPARALECLKRARSIGTEPLAGGRCPFPCAQCNLTTGGRTCKLLTEPAICC